MHCLDQWFLAGHGFSPQVTFVNIGSHLLVVTPGERSATRMYRVVSRDDIKHAQNSLPQQQIILSLTSAALRLRNHELSGHICLSPTFSHMCGIQSCPVHSMAIDSAF